MAKQATPRPGTARPAKSSSGAKASSAGAQGRSGASQAAGPYVTVRHYCQGIGDCHLLRFTRADGSPYFMLIDCGVHSSVKEGTKTIEEIVADIATVTKTIDVLVVTHEHWDHVSGFLTAADRFKSSFTVGEVWMGWTENPADKQAQQLDKFKGQALAAVLESSGRLDRASGLSPHLAGIRDGLQAILGFNFGARGERVRSARDAAAAMNTTGLRYLEPGREVLSLPGVDGLRVYVLGPPRDPAMLGLTDRASEMYGIAGAEGWPIASSLNAAFGGQALHSTCDDCAAPFDVNVGSRLAEALEPAGQGGSVNAGIRGFLKAHYAGPTLHGPHKAKPGGAHAGPDRSDQSWRRIDADWLAISASLAMQIDDRTNNTSVVLAFEFTESRRVLLFAADAQIGSWLSWQDLSWGKGDQTVTGADLLSRTVYYKVGHHGSQNATARAKGLELMNSPDLAAFIPTNKKDAKNVGWGEMPYDGILMDLEARTRGRTVRADDPWLQSAALDARFAAPSGSLRRTEHRPGLWVEFDIA